MRLLTALATFGAITQSASATTGHPAARKSHDIAPATQKFNPWDITRAEVEGKSLVVKDSDGQRWPLTLDVSLQRTAYRKLANARPEQGALVAIEVKTGRLKAFTEWPLPSARDASLLLGHQFPAASVFKIVTTVALLEQGRIDPKRVVCTEGGTHSIEREQLEVPRTGVAECNPFFDALGHSRNAVYAQLASRLLKPEDLENYADRFGFDSPVPLEVDIPMGHFKTQDDPLGFARAAVGFEGSTLSPLGAAYLAYVIASGGRIVPVHVLQVSMTAPQEPSKAFAAIRPETAKVLRQMMEVTVRRGTCAHAFHDERGRAYLDRTSVAGKTGTLDEQENTYSWFIGFAPSQAPEIVVSVLLKNGRLWHKKANEVGRDWLIQYFSHQEQVAKRTSPKANTAS